MFSNITRQIFDITKLIPHTCIQKQIFNIIFLFEKELKSYFVILEDDFFILEIYFLIYGNEFPILKIGHVFFMLEIHYLLIKNIAKHFLNIMN